MAQGLDRDSVRELMNKSAIGAVKALTSNQQMKEIHFLRIPSVHNKISLYDVMIHLQKFCKLNFITFIANCQEIRGTRNIIIACRNSQEFYSLMRNDRKINIKGYCLEMEESTRSLELNHVIVPERLSEEVKDLSRVLSFKACKDYSTVFPSERIIEFLIELREDSWFFNGLAGILLKYNHHERVLDDKITLLVSNTVGSDQSSSFLRSYGNTDVDMRKTRMLLIYKSVWRREDLIEINEHGEPTYMLTRELLSRDIISRIFNFNNIRSIMD